MTTVAETTTTVQFDTALRTLAARATERYAGEAARIDRGLCLALNGHVTLHADGTASVTSGTDAEVVYTVNGHCDCPDASRAPEGRCKHLWAKCLVKRAQAQMPKPVTYYASYYGPTVGWHPGTLHGTARYIEGAGWFFTAEDGHAFYAEIHQIALGGRVDLADAQLVDDTQVQGSRVLTLLAR